MRLAARGRSPRRGARVSTLAALLAASALACKPPEGAAPAPPELPLAPSPIAPSPPSPPAPGAIDLAITFHPGFSDHLGWVKLPAPVSLDLLGNPGARVLDAVPWSPPSDPTLQRILRESFELQLAHSALPETTLVVDEQVVCSPGLLGAVERARPHRLLLTIRGGITAKVASCLGHLPTERLYLTGCLYRSHRPEDRCDGDAEVAHLAADDAVRGRVRGLATSLGQLGSMKHLAAFPALEYLAVASGATPEPGLGVQTLPFEALPHLRYLDTSNWTDTETVFSPAALEGLARLHTLRWASHLGGPLAAPCALERYGAGAISDDDATALAACGRLRELSTDTTWFDSAEPVRRWPLLEHLHLRHWKATDLSPLADLTRLRVLSLPACKAVDYRVLAKLPHLVGVDLSQSGLTSLDDFAPLRDLEELDVGFTPVRDLAPISRSTHLTVLDLHETQVSDLGPIAPLRALRKLTLSNTPVKSLAPLTGNPSLEWVILYRSQLHDVSPLFTLPSLKRAHIGSLTLPGAQVERLREQLGSNLND